MDGRRACRCGHGPAWHDRWSKGACEKCPCQEAEYVNPLTDDGAGASTATPSPADGATSLPAPSSDFPRLFVLDRHTDVTGLSGTGVVAEGAQWSDGTASLRWLGAHPSTVAWASVDQIVAVHGHSGATELRWLDGES